MSKIRSYKLLCPIARALDRVGDRWTLLILRDLHAGPARFSDLRVGLAGVATNLLAERLRTLTDSGLIEKQAGPYDVALYALTDLGARTGDLLFELAMFGGHFATQEPVNRPGNLRSIAVTLRTACQRVLDPDMCFTAELDIDGEKFTLAVGKGIVDLHLGSAPAPDAVMTTSYEPMIAVSESELPMEEFLANHVRLEVLKPRKDRELLALLGAAIASLNPGD